MHLTKPNPTLLETRQHFEILDGLRGIAAIAVVIFHFMEIATPDYKDNFIAHSYLAVDFFSCLSGFVIAYAYDSRVKSIGVMQFFKLRLIRLHPLVIICSVLGLIAFLFDPFSDLHTAFSPVQILLMLLSSCLLIPYPVVPERYFNLFHLNPPTWSLFWEYLANIFYVLILFRLRNKILWILTIVAAIALCFESNRSGYLGVGWGGDNFIGGGIRVFYSFLAGMLVYRSNWIVKNSLGFISLGALLAVAFFIPFSDTFNRIIDPVIVIFYFPFLIALGAGASLSSLHNTACKFMGNISYPLYMVHYPFIWIFLSYAEQYKPAISEMEIVIPIAMIFLIAFAYFILAFFDIPIRQYFKDRGKKASLRAKTLSEV